MRKTKKIKRFLLVSLLVTSLLLMVQGMSFSQQKPYQGTTLRVVAPRWVWCEAFEDTSKEISEDTGINVEFTYLPWEDLIAKLLLDARAGVSTWDIVMVTMQQYPRLIEGNVLYPLDEFIYNYDIADPYKLLLEDFLNHAMEAMRYKGKIWALPPLQGPQVTAYRADLFNSPIEKKNFKEKYGYVLKPPETYAQLYDICEFFTRKAGQELNGKVLKADFYGTVHSNKKGGYLWHDYIVYMAAFGADILYDPETMKPTFDSPQSTEAVEFYNSLAKFQPLGHINMTSGEATSLFASGSVAIQIEWWDVIEAITFNPEKSKVADRTGITMVPSVEGVKGREHAAMAGLNGIGIYRHSINKEAAYKLLEEWFSPQHQRLVALEYPYLPSRYSVLRDSTVIAMHPSAKVINEMAKVGWYAFEHPRIPEYNEARDIAEGKVHQVLVGEKTLEQAVAEGQQELVRLFKEAGYIK